jgi:2-phospho-L-lactate guanylyltransferase
MSIWGLVPIKPLNRAKSRLSEVLAAEERERLALAMLGHNLRLLTDSQLFQGVMVVSRDSKALAFARQTLGVQTLQESGTPELNSALLRACKMLISLGAKAALILPADIPLVQKADLEAMIALGEGPNTLVVSPDRHQDGTNAIFSRPPDLIPFSFGLGSYRNHLEFNGKAGIRVQVYESPRLALDIDTPADLEAYQQMAAEMGEPLLPYRTLN